MVHFEGVGRWFIHSALKIINIVLLFGSKTCLFHGSLQFTESGPDAQRLEQKTIWMCSAPVPLANSDLRQGNLVAPVSSSVDSVLTSKSWNVGKD